MANEQEFSLFGGSMLSEEQFNKMMADEDTKMQQEAQLRLLPRIGPSDLPYTPSPPLVPEVAPRLPLPPRPAPGAPYELPPPPGPGEPPLAPFRRLPPPPRPRFEAGLQNPTPTPEQDVQDTLQEDRRQQMDIKRDRNERPPLQLPEQPFPPTRPQGPTQVGSLDTSGQNPISAERLSRNRLMERMRDENEQPSDPYPADIRRKTLVAQNNTTASDASPFSSAVELAQVYGPREDKYPDAGRLPQQYRDKQKDAPMIDFGATGRPPADHKEPRLDYQDDLRRGERGFGLSPNELRRERVVPPPTFDERFNIPKAGTPFSQADEERYSPETAKAYLTQGAALDRTNARLTAENGPQPNVAQRFAGEFLNGAMALMPPGPRGTPFSRSIPRSEGQMSPNAVAPRNFPPAETIAAPAVRINQDKVFTGTDHGDAWVNAGEPNVSYSQRNRAPDQHYIEDGFTTSTGRFVNRQEALDIAKENEQINPRRMREIEAGGDAWNFRLNSEDLKTPIATRGEGAATYTPRDEGQMSPSARVKRGFGDVGMEPPPDNGGPNKGGRPRGPSGYDSSTQKPGQPPIPQRPVSSQGRPREGGYIDRGMGPGANRAVDNPRTFVQGNRTYSESTGEYGRTDSGLRSVKRNGVPPEEQQTRNLDRFPEGYFDRVPRERRQMGAGLSHPGFRWQIMENGKPVGQPQMNRQKANLRADKLTSTYDKAHTVEPRPAGQGELTPSERSYLDKYEINIPRNGND